MEIPDLWRINRWPFLAVLFSPLPWQELPRSAWRVKTEEKKTPRSRLEQSKCRAVAGKRPIIVSAGNGYEYLDDAFAFLKSGGDTLDAALKVVKGPEDDPDEDSVGLGGLPNEEGVVELDSCCMHGPTRRAGSVGGVREHQERFPGGPGCDGAHRSRDVGGRGR